MYSQPNYVLVTVLFFIASIAFFSISDEPLPSSPQDSSTRMTEPLTAVIVADRTMANQQVQPSINYIATARIPASN